MVLNITLFFILLLEAIWEGRRASSVNGDIFWGGLGHWIFFSFFIYSTVNIFLIISM